jgi:5-methylcytosine-specific restriction endonuclease McrA
MILINIIDEDFDGKKVLLKDIQNDYYEKINTSRQSLTIKEFIQFSIKEKSVVINKKENTKIILNKNHLAFLEFLKKDFEKILNGDLITLNKLKNKVERSATLKKAIYQKKRKLTVFGRALVSHILNYDGFRDRKSGGVWLAKKLNIKACPYCNAQFTLLSSKGDNKFDKGFHFDHYFPKSEYPYFAISMFNLIPCCASCNQKKSSKKISIEENFHPYYKDLDLISQFEIEYPFELKKMNVKSLLLLDKEKFKIKYKPKFLKNEKSKKFVEDHDKMFNINGVYDRHSDLAKELVILSHLYSKHGFELHKELGLVSDRSTALQYLLGNYIKEYQINKRPLSKLTQDIAKQFKLIE